MFSKDTYIKRRKELKELVGSGVIIIFGNNESPCNFPNNGYAPFRQDSSFLYYFGQNRDGLVGVIDVDNDIETLGVLYMVSGDSSVTGVEDLAGRTIYLTGKGTTPDYVLHYILSGNGMDADSDCTLEYKSEATEVAALLAENPDAIGLLPQPFVTAACAQNDALSVILDMNAEWEKLQGEDGSRLVTGVTVVRNEFLQEHENAVAAFMEAYEVLAK